jgi:MOSC domain-containing protein YiiM
VNGLVSSLHRRVGHSFSKDAVDEVVLVAGMGVEGDGHYGATVQHRSRVRADPNQPNLRQVHLLPAEVHDGLRAAGWAVAPGDIGENVTTSGLDLLALPVGSVLRLGDGALVALTGLRNPCVQIERFRPGLLAQLRPRDDEGNVVRLAGVMGVVVLGGTVRVGDRVDVALPPEPHAAMDRV